MRRASLRLLAAWAVVLGWGVDASAAEGPGLLLGLPTSEFKARRDRLATKVREASPGQGATLVVLVGESAHAEFEKFRQSNNFAYLTGVDVQNAAAILNITDGTETLYLPPMTPGEERYEGKRLAPTPEAATATGFGRVEPRSRFLGDLFSALGRKANPGRVRMGGGDVVYLLESDAKSDAARFGKWLKESGQPVQVRAAEPLIHGLRRFKSGAEVALLRKTIAATGEAERAAAKLLKPGKNEYELEAAIVGAFLANGAQRAGFYSIVGSGPNSTVLHYSKNQRVIESGDLVVLDIGAETSYYTADITRTFPASGKFTPRQREVYQLVLDAQAAAAASFKVGKSSISDLNEVARETMRQSPLRAKDENGKEWSLDHFFLHGLGHQLGMDVHDVAEHRLPFQVGEVFTIEPGIYLKSEGFGVRIEDDYLVTRDGLEKLSGGIPSAPDEVEKMVGH